jgi:hypothetical protein
MPNAWSIKINQNAAQQQHGIVVINSIAATS